GHPPERPGSWLPRFITSYSLACHHWSCDGPEINSLLQRRVFQNCLAEQSEAQGQARSELRHSQEKSFFLPLNFTLVSEPNR
uniref:Uncharacterized protein n=1 Tax=Capra hircus TaxID=9925 RepID=A0A452DLY7_CAPHI